MEWLNYVVDIDLTTVLLGLVVLLLVRWYMEERRLPPGPWGLPFVGVLFTFNLADPSDKTMTQIVKKYGGIHSVRLGNFLWIFLNDFEEIKEAFGKKADVFSGISVFKIKENDRGLGGKSVGEEEKQHRKFVTSVFRNFGMGKQSFEPKILEEVQRFLKEMRKINGAPVDPSDLLGLSTLNILSSILFDERYSYDDEELLYMKNYMKDGTNFFIALALPHLFPFFKYVPFASKLLGRDKLNAYQEKMLTFIRKRIQNHIETYSDANCRDYIDAYLSHRKEIINKTGSEGFFDLKILEGNLLTLFAGASETTPVTLRWAFIYLLLNPEIGLRVQREIDNVIGPYRDPSINDRINMPYTEATLLEIQRCASLLPASMARKTTKETWVLGYRIPSGSYVSANYIAVNYDEKLWPDARTFKPERFINSKGEVEKPEYFIPFSLGKRSCVGEPLARMQLFLYFTSFLQRFDLKPAPNTTYNLDCDLMVGRVPKPFEICAVPRDFGTSS